MKSQIVFFAMVALTAARPGVVFSPYHANAGLISPYHAAGLAIAAPSVVSSQYHAQDELGQYSYGYAGGPSAKHEVKTFDGVTRGGYSYIDANGIVQSVNYIADPVNGFRVAATNLPVAPAAPVAEVAAPVVANLEAPVQVEDTAEVAAAKAAHLAAVKEAEIRAATVVAPTLAVVAAPAPVTYTTIPAAPATVAYTAIAAAPAPVAYTAIAAPSVVSSQYHAQDELGQYSYGYAGGPSAKHEVKTFDGVTRGGYSYLDANGIVQSVNYIADPVNGFRVAATNLPVAPAVAASAVPQEVFIADAPDVAAAKAEHFAAHAEAKARL
ncbi:hypothetical protein B566_EDAN008111 [Ephemera danica]|nr:hypothetical protein B566_EDAN008111 [Ephemera danica]